MSDLISRQAAIYAIEKRMDDITCEEFAEGMSEAITEISLLPPAQPYTDEEIQAMQDLEQAQLEKAYETGLREGRKKGEWFDITFEDGIEAQECSACGYIEYALYRPNFCPECGAYMRGEKNDTM